MPGLFGGLQAQAAALPPIQQRVAAPVSAPRRGLFGSRGPSLQEALLFALQGTQGVSRSREAGRLQQEQAAARQVEDRLRAQLSPADGPNGSGTGAMPSIDQQMAAINDARLLNPEVADRFAPAVMQQQRQEQARTLFANDPRAQALWASGNQSFADSLGEQYKPQVIGAGGRQSVYGEGRTVDAPSFGQINDTVIRNDPGTGTTTATFSAPPAYSDVTQRQVGMGNLGVAQGRLGLDQSMAGFTLGQGQTRYGVDGQPIAASAPAPNAAQSDNAAAYNTNQNEVIPTLNQMRSMLQSGDVIAGPGGQIRLQAARALAAAGNERAQREVAATEAYMNMSGRLRVGMAKTLGANPSNADIALLERVTAGDIGQTQDALLATLDQGLAFANQRGAFLQGQSQPQGGQQQQSSGRVAYDVQGNRYVVRNGQWVPE